MPLVVFCGLPGAGKTFVAHALVEYLRENVQEDVVYITEATVNVDRRDGYKGYLLRANECSAIAPLSYSRVDLDSWMDGWLPTYWVCFVLFSSRWPRGEKLTECSESGG